MMKQAVTTQQASRKQPTDPARVRGLYFDGTTEYKSQWLTSLDEIQTFAADIGAPIESIQIFRE